MKKQVEAVLFSSGKKMTVEELARVCGVRDYSKIVNAIEELRKEYEEKDTALKLMIEPDGYKLNVKEEHAGIVQKVVSQTELSKTLMETLAVIAWKYPCVQSEVIKVRTNKAYDHLKELENLNFITREVYGRTKKIRLTERFFEYFDLPEKTKRKEIFNEEMSEEAQEKVRQTLDDIDKKEEEVEEAKKLVEEQEKRMKEIKEEKHAEDAETVLPPLQEQDVVPEPDTEPDREA